MPKKTKQAPVPAPHSAAEHLAVQTGTNASDWTYVPTNTSLYKRGYRWWNKVTNQYAKRATP